MTEFNHIVIRNLDRNNRKFRPSDWADRMASMAARFEDGRLKYDARVMPCRKCDDIICLQVNRAIANDRPDVLSTIEDFMQMHQLDDFVAQCPTYADAVAAQLDEAPDMVEDALLVAANESAGTSSRERKSSARVA